MKKFFITMMLLLSSLSIFSKQYRLISRSDFLSTLQTQRAISESSNNNDRAAAITQIINQVHGHDFIIHPQLSLTTRVIGHQLTTFEIHVPLSSYPSPRSLMDEETKEDE